MALDPHLLLCPKIDAKLSKNNIKPEKIKFLVENQQKKILTCGIKFGIN